MESLLKTRRYAKRCLTRLFDESKEVQEVEQIRVFLDALSEAYEAFKTNHEAIIQEATDDEFDSLQDEFEDFSQRYRRHLTNLRTALSTVNSTSRSSIGSTISTSTEIKLPSLELPTFNGNVIEWPSFVDLFQSAVGSHNHLTPAQKLQYLKASMRGEASNVLRHLPTTDAAYEEAWVLLRSRFQNVREIIQGHLRRLIRHERISGTATSLRNLLDRSNECRHALLMLSTSVEDAVFNFIVWDKLDSDSRRCWELSLTDDKVPNHNEMIQFLEQRARALTTEDSQPEKISNVNKTTLRPKCPACTGNHPVYSCENFKKTTLGEKEALVKSAKLCYNCLGSNHSSSQCISKGCKKCNKKHHTLLHNEKIHLTPSHCNYEYRPLESMTTLLATAIIEVKDNNGKKHKVRSLLDLGSTVSFVTDDLVNRLRLKRQPSKMSWSGVGGESCAKTNFCVQMKGFSVKESGFSFPIKAFVIGKITANQPTCDVKGTSEWPHIRSISLADPEFYKTRPIDLLLGTDVLSSLMREGVKMMENLPTAQNTALGWVLFGPISKAKEKTNVASSLCVSALEQQIQKFWEIEDLEEKRVLSVEEAECEEFFKNTHSRTTDGRYVVKLPFKEDAQEMDFENKSLAFKRFMSLENKLKKNQNFNKEYIQVIRDYQGLGHLQLASGRYSGPKSYLPHHAVVKADRSTTKLRIVFDASAKLGNKHSLNEALLNGPKLQDDLIDILIRFRYHKIVFTADIEKMYRQIKLHPSDVNYQRIFWREHEDQPIQEFCLTTVTFGVKTAPYLATRVLKQLAEDEKYRFPLGSEVLRNDFYVDDLLSGSDTLDHARMICRQLDLLLSSGGFVLRKWASNDYQALEGVPEEKRAKMETGLSIDEGEFLKTLGLRWNPNSDSFSFKIHELSTGNPSKRSVLSDICRTFDPLGWLSPFTIRGKIIFQELWKRECHWDEVIPEDVMIQWKAYKTETIHLQNIIIPRRVMFSEKGRIMLCGFSDASEKAYAAAVYVRSINEHGEIVVRLVAAKTRVAPLKITTIPRLELNAALLLAKLMKRVSNNFSVENMFAWTDSTVTLAWIRGDPSKWKPYVSHRVTKILDLIPKSKWYHVTSKNNPADCASRGIGSFELKDNELWWFGPSFLLKNDFQNIKEPEPVMGEINKERKGEIFVIHYSIPQQNEILIKFSNFQRLLRVTAYIWRFIKKCRKQSSDTQKHVTLNELRFAEIYWLRVIQGEHFCDDLERIKKGKNLSGTSKILNLTPFLDKDGLLRVGGRLQNAPIKYDKKHPILLPKASHFTDILVRHLHKLYCHAGPMLLLNIIRQKYWIISGKNVVRKIVIQCLKCHRLKAKGSTQQMAALPPSRVAPNPAFNTCGVDYAGPVTLRSMTGRKCTHKAYIAVFVCFTTKAIHLELVSSLTTQAFIAALRRFVSRRGLCYTIYSDCGTNFVGANKELKAMLKLAKEEFRNTEIASQLSTYGIDWRFNPPSTPHFGGLWEAGVKSVKTHLYRIIGNVVLNFEEMTTVLYQIEACLNSRPLYEASSDPTDFEALTPGHFLIGRPLTAIPEPDLTNISQNRLVRFKLCQKLVQHFWKRWSVEYISRLQRRPKWLKSSTNLRVGQLVLLMETNMSPLLWKLGRVVEVHPGSDGLVRVVSVKTAFGIKKRPIVKIAPLPIESDPSDIM